MDIVILLLTLLFAVWLWQDSLRARESAIVRCQRACKDIEAQLLDETVAMVKLKLKRDNTGQVRIFREYVFEFSTDGANRYNGHIMLLSKYVMSIHLDHPNGSLILPPNSIH